MIVPILTEVWTDKEAFLQREKHLGKVLQLYNRITLLVKVRKCVEKSKHYKVLVKAGKGEETGHFLQYRNFLV